MFLFTIFISNFSHYRERFTMPGDTDNLFYSFDLGPIHFIAFSTEVYHFIDYGYEPIVNQYEWLNNDLMRANLPENREIHPWIITYGHRPMYCSVNNKECSRRLNVMRDGIPFSELFGLEELFYDHGVDLEFWGHQHCYERLFPVYNFTVQNGSHAHGEYPYVNPGAPIHITTGAAGNKEGPEVFTENKPYWSAFRSVVRVFIISFLMTLFSIKLHIAFL